MNDGIFGEEVAVILHFVIEDGGLEEHLLGVLQVLPHGQLGRLRILAHQGLEDLVVIVAPAGDSLVVDMLVELAPVGVALAMQPGSQGFGVGEIVVKRGSEPCLVVTATQRIEIAALRLSAEQVIDTTAAGDSFSAGYLAARLQGAYVTDAAAKAIRQMRAAYPDLLIGAGTVLNREQVDAAVAAGADFIVSPGFNPTTVQYCLDKDVTIIPGVNNPSLVEQAMEMGLRHLKFFPAEQSGGIAMLKALGAVYPVRFMPTGGVTPANLKEYLGLNAVIACGGTWMVPAKLIDEGRWEELAALVREAVAAL